MREINLHLIPSGPLDGYLANIANVEPVDADLWGCWLYTPANDQGDEILMDVSFNTALAMLLVLARLGARASMEVYEPEAENG